MLIGVLVMVLILTLIPVGVTASASTQSEIKVYLDGKRLHFAIPPVIREGTTLVQFRPIFEALGFEVGWDGDKREVSGVKEGLELRMILGDNRVHVLENGRSRAVKLEVPADAINGNTMVPLRFVSEVSGKFVEWHGAERKITIDTGFTQYREHDPYARESFVPLKDAPDLLRIDPDFYQDGQYVYVTWYKSTRINDFEGYDFYVSVAKGNNWIVENKKFHSILAQRGTKFDIQFFDGAYYIKDNASIKEVRPTHEGKADMKYIANGLPNYNGRDWMKPIIVEGRVGILYGSEVQIQNFDPIKHLRIYYNNPEDTGYAYQNRYYEIEDVYGILSKLRGEEVLVYNPKRDIVYILEQQGYRQLDTKTGDLKYDREGNDLVIKYDPEISNSGTKVIVSNGEIHLLYRLGREEKYKYAKLLSTMSLADQAHTQITHRDIGSKFITFDSDAEALKFWEFYNHSRKPAVHMVEYRKP